MSVCIVSGVNVSITTRFEECVNGNECVLPSDFVSLFCQRVSTLVGVTQCAPRHTQACPRQRERCRAGSSLLSSLKGCSALPPLCPGVKCTR